MRFSPALLVAAAVLLAAVSRLSAQPQQPPRNEPVLPLPAVTDVDPRKARLGERLFEDKRLSGDGTVSCRSCHLQHEGLADSRRESVGAYGVKRALNSPTLLNIRFVDVGLNWTGRTPSLDQQIEGSIVNKDTMANDWNVLVKTLAADPDMVKAFAEAFPGEAMPVSKPAIKEAIVSYERSLVTPSRFDDWLQGKSDALTEREKAGYAKFKSYGCVACHFGVNLGAASFARLGITGDYLAYRQAKGRGAPNDLDRGRFQQTKKPEDMFVFRVPMLRNVALTAPYLHDGSVPTLDETIELMGRFQLGREIPPADRAEIAAFLRSLTGKDYERYLR